MRGKGALVNLLVIAFAYFLYAKEANALEVILSSGLRVILSDKTTRQSNPQQPQKTKSESASVPQKHYNWIKPNRYSDWQCAYELIYDGDSPYGFKLYVDIDGDRKSDYVYKYDLLNVGHYYTGVDFDFQLDSYYSPVGNSSFEDNAIKALNICGLQAIRQFIYYETDHDDPADYIVGKINFGNYHYPFVSFYEK